MCVRLPVSTTASPSFTAATVTVCAVAQLPLSPPVKVSDTLSPAAPVPLTVTAPRSVAGTAATSVTFTPGSVFSLTVYVADAAAPPSSVTATERFDTTMPAGTSISTSKPLSSSCGAAPPPTVVPLAPISAVKAAASPSATSSVLLSAEAVVSRISVAVLTSSVACPVNFTFGVAVPAPEIVTPVFSPLPDFSSRSSQSPVVTPVPPISSGTTMFSPAPSPRGSVTVNSNSWPACTAMSSVRESDTTVGLVSVMVMACDTVSPARTSAAGSVPKLTVNVSFGSSSRSSAIGTRAVPVVAPDAMVRPTTAA